MTTPWNPQATAQDYLAAAREGRSMAEPWWDDFSEFLTADFTVAGRPRDTVFLLTPISDAARAWAERSLPEDAQHLGDGIAVEHRYISTIVEGIRADGLTVRWTSDPRGRLHLDYDV